ncbi:hypothetical protein QRX50_26240 [Amycolatopsis carbonis]|uniref:Uncharacterized protein n=1 Tax=Amycolatopsis carbonis TaxID=715471 RepID=A0A9Y2I760_9PSEU|nr:hypothetical protein [Amycolatopsis sp. 2-15]WIX75050.1 hypothetical protein QRX50_26240 [Amycolatopsis sp. 2-15]
MGYRAAGGSRRVGSGGPVVCDLAEQVRLQSVTAAMAPDVLTLGRPGPHHARVHEGGRAATAELGEGTFAAGAERWLIQLWPA